MKSGKIRGAEDGIFFTTKKDGEASGFGDYAIIADIPIEMLDIDDDFGDELHLRIPTDRIGQSVDISKFLTKESYCPNCGESKEQPKDNDVNQWITVNGVHIPIKKGQNKDDVVKQFLDKQKGKEPKPNKPTNQSKSFSDLRKSFSDEEREKIYNVYNKPKRPNDVSRDDLYRIQSQFTSVKNPELIELRSKLADESLRKQAVIDVKKYLSEDDYKLFKKQIDYEDSYNNELENLLKSQKYVFRGVSKKEYDSMMKTGVMSGDDSNFGFKFATFTPDKATTFSKNLDDFVIKLDVSKLGNNVKAPRFTTFADSHDNFDKGFWIQGTEFEHHSLAIKNGTSVDSIVDVFQDKDNEHYTPKKLKFEFNEKLDPLLEDVDAFTHSSSFVGQVIYDFETQDMAANLNGKRYVWCNVPARKFEGWRGANSKGAFFAREIKGQFDC